MESMSRTKEVFLYDRMNGEYLEPEFDQEAERLWWQHPDSPRNRKAKEQSDEQPKQVNPPKGT